MALQYPGISYLKGYDGKISDIIDSWIAGEDAGRTSRDEDQAGGLVAKLFGAQNGGQAAPVPRGLNTDALVSGSVDAATAAQDPMLSAYFASTRRSESGGNDNAKNPNSSATGRYQFLDSTWQGLAQQHPELGLTPDGRNDPAQQERAMKAFTMDNARQLKGAGVGVNPGTLYAAHFLGAGGASKVLSAAANTPVASLVGPEVVQANPQLANMTVGEFQQWAASKGGNGSGGYAGPMTASTPATGGGPRGIDPQLVNELFANRATRPLVAELFKNQATAAKPTDDIAEYTFALGQGYRGSFEEWQKENKAGVTVNTGDNSSAFGKKADETAAGRMSDYVTAGNDATNFVGDLQTLGAISQNLQTGKNAEVLAALGPYAEAVGIDMKGLDEAQAYEAVVARMAPAMRIPGSGASSDFDAKQFLSSLPSLGKTPEGNRIVMDTFQGIQERKIKASEYAQQALSNQITWQEADKKIAALGDPYTAFNEYRKRVEAPAAAGAPDPAATANPDRPSASYDGDPKLWQFLTPEEKALWP